MMARQLSSNVDPQGSNRHGHRMTGLPQKPPSSSKKPKASQPDKKHQNELLDEALEETFPASDPPAMIEPAPDSSQADDDGQTKPEA
jgi:hypothetical protein